VRVRGTRVPAMRGPTLGAMKPRRRWGTRGLVALGGKADSFAALRNGNAKGWWRLEGKQIPSLRYGMEMQRGWWRLEGKQIPSLRYGMEMQRVDGGWRESRFLRCAAEWKCKEVGGGWRESRFLRCATEWKCKGLVAVGGKADSFAALRNGNAKRLRNGNATVAEWEDARGDTTLKEVRECCESI